MAEDQSKDQEKSHDATPTRIKKAREKGDVPMSPEANTAAAYIGFITALLVAGGWAASHIGAVLKSFLARPETYTGLQPAGEALSGDAVYRAVADVFTGLAPILLLPAAFVLASLFAQQAIVFAPTKIVPKWSRLSLVSNAQQKFGPRGIAEFARSVLKLSFVLAVAGIASLAQFENLPAFAGLDPALFGPLLFREALFLLALFAGAATVIGLIDLPWRRFEHEKKLRMSFQELKEEMKESEGDPHLRQARRDRGRAAAQARQMQEVPNADVVIVNPTHFAVALKWEREKKGAPVCVAKGVDEVARRIRELAAEHGVPVRRDPPTARSIYDLVEVGDEIQREHYAAVAAAIHFAEEMRKKSGKYSRKYSRGDR